MKTPILHLLGMAKRAGKLEIGEEPVGAVARAKHAKLILLASDVPPNTSRRAATFGQVGNVLQISLPYTKEELGFVLGRSAVSMVALTDAGFAGAVGDKLIELDPVRYGAAGAQLRAKADKTLARQKEKRQHEKNLQRGKGKPWAVPPKVAQEKQEQQAKKKKPDLPEKARNKSPNFKSPSEKYSSGKKSGDKKQGFRDEKEFSKRSPKSGMAPSKSQHKKYSTPRPPLQKGKRMVVKGKPHGSSSAPS